MRILIADDDDIALEILENALAQFGYQVTVAHDGREALEIVRSGQFRMVISDWLMPKMTRRGALPGDPAALGQRLRLRHPAHVAARNAKCRRRHERRRRRLHQQTLPTPGARGADPRRGAHPCPGKPGTDHLQHGQACRIPRSGDRRAPGADTGVLPGHRRAPVATGQVPRPSRRRLRAAHLHDQPAARHRQGGHPRPHPAQARPAHRGRIRDHEEARGNRRSHPGRCGRRASRSEVPLHGAGHRPLPSREVRRQRLSERAGGRGHSALRADRRPGRRL